MSSQPFPVQCPYLFPGPLPFPLFQSFFLFVRFRILLVGSFRTPFSGFKKGWRVGRRAFSAWSASLASGVGVVPCVFEALVGRDGPGESVSMTSSVALGRFLGFWLFLSLLALSFSMKSLTSLFDLATASSQFDYRVVFSSAVVHLSSKVLNLSLLFLHFEFDHLAVVGV